MNKEKIALEAYPRIGEWNGDEKDWIDANYHLRNAFIKGLEYNESLLSEKESEIVEVLGLANPYPLSSVLEHLINATNILLIDKGYDGGTYEEMEQCVRRGNEIIGHFNAFLHNRNYPEIYQTKISGCVKRITELQKEIERLTTENKRIYTIKANLSEALVITEEQNKQLRKELEKLEQKKSETVVEQPVTKQKSPEQKFKRGDKVNFKGDGKYPSMRGTYIWAVSEHMMLMYYIEHPDGNITKESIAHNGGLPDGFETPHSKNFQEGLKYICVTGDQLELVKRLDEKATK